MFGLIENIAQSFLNAGTTDNAADAPNKPSPQLKTPQTGQKTIGIECVHGPTLYFLELASVAAYLNHQHGIFVYFNDPGERDITAFNRALRSPDTVQTIQQSWKKHNLVSNDSHIDYTQVRDTFLQQYEFERYENRQTQKPKADLLITTYGSGIDNPFAATNGEGLSFVDAPQSVAINTKYPLAYDLAQELIKIIQEHKQRPVSDLIENLDL